MRIDVPTLYFLTLATLCVAIVLTLWDRTTQDRRRDVLGIWALGYGVLAAGCLVMMSRAELPGILGEAGTNVVMVAGYFLLLHGVARLDGEGCARPAILSTGLVALVWMLEGAGNSEAFWHFGSALPIALIHLAIVRRLLKSPAARPLRARRLAIAIAAGHGLFYTARFALVPVLASVYGPDMLAVSAEATMVEAVLYSVAMPMAFLALLREEAQVRLLDAARTDYLTGLGNRHALFDRGADVLAASAGSVVLLAFDLDHFKSINDRHGHAAGDAVLTLFAKVARETLGPGALLARIGGEEFAALLPATDAVHARPLAEALCRAFTRQAGRPEGLAIRATVSVGLAEGIGGTRDLAGLLSAADRALYAAKSLGRDRVEIADAAPLSRAA